MYKEHVVLALPGTMNPTRVWYSINPLVEKKLIEMTCVGKQLYEKGDIDNYPSEFPEKSRDYASKVVEAVKSLELDFPVTIIHTPVLNRNGFDSEMDNNPEYKQFKVAYFEHVQEAD